MISPWNSETLIRKKLKKNIIDYWLFQKFCKFSVTNLGFIQKGLWVDNEKMGYRKQIVYFYQEKGWQVCKLLIIKQSELLKSWENWLYTFWISTVYSCQWRERGYIYASLRTSALIHRYTLECVLISSDRYIVTIVDFILDMSSGVYLCFIKTKN